MGDDGDSGVKRVKSLFKLSHGAPMPHELQGWPTTVLTASTLGFLFGGFIGARWAGDKYIAMNHNTKYPHAMQAQRELHGASMLGFLRQGSKWGVRMGVFTGIFSGCNILFSVYRDREDLLNTIAAGGVTGLLFRVRYGIKPAVGGFVLGILLSFPLGVLMNGFDWLFISQEERERVREWRRQARRKRECSWDDRLNAINEVMESLNIEDTKESTHSLKTYYKLKRSDKQE